MIINKKNSFRLLVKKGFTLIELLVVIGIMAVLAAGVVALINPLEKTRQANDANAQNAVGQVATALQSYAAQQTNGQYPAAGAGATQGLNALTTSGELTAMPAGVTLTYLGGGATAGVYAQLTSAKYIDISCPTAGDNAYWFWSSTNGRACGFCGNAAPAVGSACSF